MRSSLLPYPVSTDRPRFAGLRLFTPTVSLLLLAFASAPAHAGHWVLTTTGSGTATVNGMPPQTATIPGPATNTVTISSIAAGAAIGPSFGSPNSVSASASMNITVTGTWTANGNSDDTAPPNVVVGVTSSARGHQASSGGPDSAGMADDGYGDPVSQTGDYVGTSATPSTKYIPGSSFSVTLNLSAAGTGTSSSHGSASGGASVGPITVAVHAQPYNFRKLTGVDNGDGTISFTYNWSSTSGSNGDLTTCSDHERVTYPGGNPYVLPVPFDQSYGITNPTVNPPNPRSMASHNGSGDIQKEFPMVSPYSAVSDSANQRYEFNDSATGETNVLIPGPDSTATITRSVLNNRPPYANTVWWYYVTKQGVFAYSPQPLP